MGPQDRCMIRYLTFCRSWVLFSAAVYESPLSPLTLLPHSPSLRLVVHATQSPIEVC